MTVTSIRTFRAFRASLAALWLSLAVVAGPVRAETDTVELPETAVCRVCEVRGSQHGAEAVAAWRDHDGDRYYFCSTGCGEAFDGFPAGYQVNPVPRSAPPLALTTLDGRTVSLAQAEGPVLVDFWATWCQPCIAAMPELIRLHDEYRELGLTVLGVSIDEKGAEHVSRFVKERGLPYPVAVDGGDSPAWFAWGVAAIPAAFLVDGGEIVAEWRGRVDPEALEAAIGQALSTAP
jgi:thiol-disulfide isomerase/thioredoxin